MTDLEWVRLLLSCIAAFTILNSIWLSIIGIILIKSFDDLINKIKVKA